MYESWFCTTPDIIGLAGSIRLTSLSSGLPMYSFMKSSSGRRARSTVRGEEAVLHVEEGRIRRLCSPAGNQAQIPSLLGITAEKHPPAAIGHAHHVVMSGMHVERVAGQRPGPNIHHHRQPLAGDGVKHLLH